MSSVAPEIFKNPALAEMLADPDGYMHRTYGIEFIKDYQKAGRLSRWVIAKLFPEVADYADFLDRQQSIIDARRSADAIEGQIIIV